jgi:pyruvate-formate lyase-activating enzyme
MRGKEVKKKLKEIKRNICFEKHPPLPINMIVEVTNACNHACMFCAHSKMQRKVGMMDFDFFKNVSKQAYDGGTREIGFYLGGEPLANKNLSSFVSYAHELGFEYIYMTTNGALADIDIMKELIRDGLNSVKFSINAGTAETYKKIHGRDDFDVVITNLINLSNYVKAEKMNVGLFVSYVICCQNKDEVVLLRDRIEKYVDDMVTIQAYNQGGNMYEINDGITLDPNYVYAKAPCSMIFNRIHITWEGYLNACCVDFNNDLVVADLNKTPLLEAWNSEKMVGLREMHLNNKFPTDVMCYNCLHNSNQMIRPI